MTTDLYRSIIDDLSRPHDVALERGGFAFGKLVLDEACSPLVLINRYTPISDEDYVDDPGFAACFNGDAIRKTMQELRNKRNTAECAFHVHMHEHRGRPTFSRPDMRGLPPMIPSFARASGDGANGLLVLSYNNAAGLAWLPGHSEPSGIDRITIIGKPLLTWVSQ